MRRQFTMALGLAGAALLLIACSGSATTVQEVTLVSQGMQYQPNTIEVVAGQPVKLTFQNNDTVEHDFSILEIPVTSVGAGGDPMAGHDMSTTAGEPQLHTAAAAGQASFLEFTPTKGGTYEFFCTVAGHMEAGMQGTLIVKAP